jgi:protein-tyrosine phosphatase
MTRPHLRWDNCYNIRDLGGHATADGGQTRWRAIVRADNLGRLTPGGRAALLDYGVRTIVDLRRAGELAIAPSPFATLTEPASTLTYLNLPLGVGASDEGRAAVLAVARGDRPSLQELFCVVLDNYWRGIASVMGAIATAPQGAVLFHCQIGKDRTGLIAALLLALAGVPYEAIADEYALSGRCLQPYVEERLSQVPNLEKRERLARLYMAAPETMLGILGYLDRRHGGVESYLLAAGVAADHLERIRERIVIAETLNE